jgi:hypothetical protein
MIRLTPIKAIRAKCLDCTGNQPKEVRLCTCLSCPSWGYRMGVRPEHKRALEANEDAEREKLRGSPMINCSNAVETSAGSKQEELTLQKSQKVTEDTERYR